MSVPNIAASLLLLVCLSSAGVLEYAMRQIPAKPMRIKSFSWESCTVDPDNAIVDVMSFDMPETVYIPGENKLGLTLNIKEDLDTQLRVKIRLVKKVFGLIGVPIPCISNIGSCTYEDLCPLLLDFWNENGRCPANVDHDLIKCYCPLEKTDGYERYDVDFNIDPDDLSSLLAWLASGTYEITVEGSMNGREVGCLNLNLEITQG